MILHNVFDGIGEVGQCRRAGGIAGFHDRPRIAEGVVVAEIRSVGFAITGDRF